MLNREGLLGKDASTQTESDVQGERAQLCFVRIASDGLEQNHANGKRDEVPNQIKAHE
jgi:hypothetical protein